MTTDADAEADAKTVTEQPHAYRLPLTALVATEVSAAQDALDNAADPAWIRRHLHADVRLPQRIDIDRADAAPGDPKAIVALAVNIEADTPEHRAMMAKVSGPER